MKTKLIAIDLDGTLLTSKRRIDPRSVEAIAKAIDAGITIVLASGRIRTSMLKFAAEIGLEASPMICGNGTYAYANAEEKLFTMNLNEEAQNTVRDYAISNDLHMNLYTEDRLFFLKETPWGDMYRNRVETIVPETLSDQYEKILCVKAMIVDHPENIAHHLSVLAPMVQPFDARATESEPEYLEFMALNANKGSALATLSGVLGIRQEETAAIGDYLNDVEMLEWAGQSAAMANGHDLAKKAAKTQVSSNDEGGVAEFIESIVLQQKE